MDNQVLATANSSLNSYNVIWGGVVYAGYDERTLLDYIRSNQVDGSALIQKEGESSSAPASEWAKSRISNLELAIPIQAEVMESSYIPPLDLPKANIKISRNLITKIWALPLPLRIVVITVIMSFHLRWQQMNYMFHDEDSIYWVKSIIE